MILQTACWLTYRSGGPCCQLVSNRERILQNGCMQRDGNHVALRSQPASCIIFKQFSSSVSAYMKLTYIKLGQLTCMHAERSGTKVSSEQSACLMLQGCRWSADTQEYMRSISASFQALCRSTCNDSRSGGSYHCHVQGRPGCFLPHVMERLVCAS